jgi:hypothetical protein
VRDDDLFQAHIGIAAGDILGMGIDEGVSLIDEVEALFTKTPDKRAVLYVSSGDSDLKYDEKIADNLNGLDQRLKKLHGKNLSYKSVLFENEGHYDHALPAIAEAIELMFPRASWSPDFMAMEAEEGRALENIDAYYQSLTEQIGISVLPRAERWNSGNSLAASGRRLLRSGRTGDAVKILKRRAEYRPYQAGPLMDLADAYSADGKNQLAEKALIAALALVKDGGHQHAEINKKLNAIQKLSE